MLKRFCVAMLFAGFTLPAFATDYSDMWYQPGEGGWGANFTQNENVIFITFFIYDSNGNPTWYDAIAWADANGNYSGSLYSNVGTYFGAQWDQSRWASTLAGTATFSPIDAVSGTLSYTLTGGPTVNKTLVRLALTAINLNGNFTGGQAGSYSGCSSASSYKDTFNMNVTQNGASLTLSFSYDGLGETCTLSGTLVQQGQLISVPSATYMCEDGLNTQASMSEIKRTSQGIEGRFAAPDIGGGCREDASFSGVSLQ